jgi:Mce-associated membrane protein
VGDETMKIEGRRRGLSLSLAVVVAALVSACAAGLLYASRHIGGGTASGNRALVDSSGTNRVLGDVSDVLTQVLSYSPDDTTTTEKAAAIDLVGHAADQYRSLFSLVKQQAPVQRLALTTRVVRAGVTSLTGDTASLLVFLDQTTSRQGKPSGQGVAAQLAITASLRGGHWRIADIRAS